MKRLLILLVTILMSQVCQAGLTNATLDLDNWQSPISATGGYWNNVNKSIDGDSNSYASHLAEVGDNWKVPVIFSVPETQCSEIRFLVTGDDGHNGHFYVRGHYYDVSWHTVDYAQVSGTKYRYEFSLGDVRIITKFKLDWKEDSDWYSELRFYEAEYNEVEESIPEPIPAPSAILLSGIGVGFVGWLRRRYMFRDESE